MKLTKFAQSCAMIETSGKKILVDPGNLELNDDIIKKWIGADFVFVTHKHGDHFSEETFNKIKNEKTKIYSTKEVAITYPNTKFEILKENDVLNLDGFSVNVVKAVHGYIPLLKGGGEINENIGYVFEINNKKLYFTSDCISFENPPKCDLLFVPVCNHGLVMGPFDAALFAKETEAKLVIPIHYNNPRFPADLTKVKEEFEKQKLNYKFLEIGETIEI